MPYREDFFRMLEGKTPVSDVPLFKFFAEPDQELGTVAVMPSIMAFGDFDEQGRNPWGVPYKVDDFGTGFMPAPGEFILKDVTKWRDIIKAPYIPDYDWAKVAEADLANVSWNQETQMCSLFGLLGGYFLSLASFMGFEGAMLAMYDEPEAVHELLDYLCDYDIWLTENIIKHYPIVEIIGMNDDNATEINPFISYDMFKEFLLPRYKRMADLITGSGKILSYHNCGRCEDFMDDMVDIGTQIWNCATPVNDLMGFKEKYDNKIILEFLPRIILGTPEEQVRQQVRTLIDTYAPGGAFVWAGNSLTMNPEAGAELDAWIYDEVETYGKDYYKK